MGLTTAPSRLDGILGQPRQKSCGKSHVLSTIASLLLLSASPAAACETMPQVVTQLRSAFPEARLEQSLSGAQAQDFTERYNRIPPVSNLTADRVLIFGHPKFPDVRRVQVFFEGCQVGYGMLPTRVVEAFLGSDV